MGKRRKTQMSLYVPDGPVLAYLLGSPDRNEAALKLMELGLLAKLNGVPSQVNVTSAKVKVISGPQQPVAQNTVNVNGADKPFSPGWDDDPN